MKKIENINKSNEIAINLDSMGTNVGIKLSLLPQFAPTKKRQHAIFKLVRCGSERFLRKTPCGSKMWERIQQLKNSEL